MVNNVIVLVVMSLTGLVIGWRIRGSVLDALIAYALMLLFSYAISWIMACIGLKVKAPEIVNNAAFMVIFPLTFIANTFVPAENMPSALKWFAGWNPVSTITHAARERFRNLGAMGGDSAAMREKIEYTWALQHAEIYTLAWVLVVLAIFVPLATRIYARAVAK